MVGVKLDVLGFDYQTITPQTHRAATLQSRGVQEKQAPEIFRFQGCTDLVRE